MPTPPLRSPTELCQRLEDRGIPTWSQGEGLLDDLRADHHGTFGSDFRVDAPVGEDGLRGLGTGAAESAGVLAEALTRSLLCDANVAELLSVLPRAVVTASQARRLTVATTTGPIDIFPFGSDRLEELLLGFGLSPLSFAFRPVEKQWCDPCDARKKFESGRLDLATSSPNPFLVAPRRYWIAARLLSQYQLEPSAKLLESAQAALPIVLERLPQAAPARRELSRVLSSPDPALGLAFLRNSGVSSALFPGMKRAGESLVAKLGPRPALRWAAWLDGSAIARGVVKLRMPHALARSIERLHRAHPIDRTIASLREAGPRKILQRLDREEIDGLVLWRRLELANAIQTEQTRQHTKLLDDVEAQLAKLRLDRERSHRVRALALDGKTVMSELGAGPGPHVGRALAHLAQFVDGHPEANEPDLLTNELREWAREHFQSEK